MRANKSTIYHCDQFPFQSIPRVWQIYFINKEGTHRFSATDPHQLHLKQTSDVSSIIFLANDTFLDKVSKKT